MERIRVGKELRPRKEYLVVDWSRQRQSITKMTAEAINHANGDAIEQHLRNELAHAIAEILKRDEPVLLIWDREREHTERWRPGVELMIDDHMRVERLTTVTIELPEVEE